MKPVYTFRVLRLTLFSIPRSLTNLLILTTSTFLLNIYSIRAEGTKQVMPLAANGTGLIVSTTSGFPLGNVGAYVPIAGPTPVDQRIFFHIKSFSTETLYYGFNWETLAPSGTISTYNDVYMDIYDPTGALVTTIHLPGAPGAGFINTWTSGATGPHVGAARAAGYTPLSFAPTMNGDYYVNFYRSSDGGATHMSGGESMLSKYFDMTVCQGTAMILGRIHCNEWAFSVYNPASGDIQDPNSSSNAEFYAYTDDSVVTRVYFPSSGFKPLSYILAVNGFGVINGGNWQQDRKSINLPKLIAPYLTGGFDIFLNPPDPTLYPSCIIPSPPILLAPTISGCPPGPFNVRFFAPQAGDYYMILDLNGTPGYQPNTADRYIELISVAPGIITYLWDGKDGLGAVVPPGTKVPVQFSFRKGRINIPLYDDEMNVNGFSVDAVAPINAVNTTLFWDDSQLTSMGTECTTSNNNNYTGIGYQDTAVGQASPGHAWNGNGNPSFSIPAPAVNYSGTNNDADNIQCNDFGNARLINTWAWGIVLNTYDTFTLTCITVSGTVWDDADNSANGAFLNIQTNSETGTNAGNALYASLIDPVSGTVLSSAPVNANGTYTVVNCPANAPGMFVVISTTAGINGQPAPTAAIPSTWLNTSPLTHTFASASVNVMGIDFGIEQLPDSYDQNYTIAVPAQNSFLSLNGAGTAASPGPLTGADPEDGVMGNGKAVVIMAVPTNEQLYYNNVLVTNGTLIPNYNPGKLQVKFISVTETILSFQYAYVDAAGKQDPTAATYTINMSTTLATALATFSGRITDLGNVLSWVAENGSDGVTFTVQHATDGIHFTSIGQVLGNATTDKYSFTDINPIPNTPNYYRLQWTSTGGIIAYSNTVTMASTSSSAVLDVSPNPFKDHVNVRLNLAKAENVSVRLLDSKGMLLNQTFYQGVKGINSFPVQGLGSLPASVYFIQIKLDDQVFVRKVFNN